MQAVGARASGSAVAFTPGVKASHRCHKAASAGLRSSSTRHQGVQRAPSRVVQVAAAAQVQASAVEAKEEYYEVHPPPPPFFFCRPDSR
jgi:hypothetical protein